MYEAAFANGRGLRVIPAIMVVLTGLVVAMAGLTGCSRGQNDAQAENAYAQLPLGALTKIEMIRYITEQGGEAITTNNADNLYRMRMGDDYLVLVCGLEGTIDAIAVYSETGDLLDTKGVDPIAFDREHVPQTYAELCERYGAPHGERGSGLYYACYLTERRSLHFVWNLRPNHILSEMMIRVSNRTSWSYVPYMLRTLRRWRIIGNIF